MDPQSGRPFGLRGGPGGTATALRPKRGSCDGRSRAACPSAEPPGRDTVEPVSSAPPRQTLDSDQPQGAGLLPRTENSTPVDAGYRFAAVCHSSNRKRRHQPSPMGHQLVTADRSTSDSPQLSAATTSDLWTGSPAEANIYPMARDHGDVN